jgi:hypothetical protein
VCVPSLNRCDKCGRFSCREHVGLCHAAAGEPASLTLAPSPKRREEEPPASLPLPPLPVGAKATQRRDSPPARQKGRKGTGLAPRAALQPVKGTGRLSPSKIEVNVEPGAPVVNAFVLTKGAKQVAVRSWVLADQGVIVTCHCEKGYRCPAHGMLLDPAGADGIESQIRAQIEDLRREYGIPTQRVLYHAVVSGVSRQVPRLMLPGEWKKRRE